MLSLVFPWPLIVAFWLSEGELNRLADQVVATGSLPAPRQAGWFWIEGARVEPSGNVALLIDASPGGRRGFLRSGPKGWTTPPLVVPTDTVVHLSRSWIYASED